MDSDKSIVEVSNNAINDNEFVMRNPTSTSSSSDRISSIDASSTPKKQSRQRTNTLRILIHATMQLLTSPPLSPTLPSSPSESISSTDSEQSSYISFPEYEAFIDELDDNVQNVRGESMVLQMEEFDEMLVNGVQVLRSSN
ncbi:12615_t:CDS:1 [Ambispora gerdemannii]|uniref:12615_t:CDS:1 n=1 Tax=Ambispora gerdemannii TaxID=144530 RepID=A0A9N8Z2P8_9GLOM|nr:12615_t:CDS:1 [Ambispora gerdemannii]